MRLKSCYSTSEWALGCVFLLLLIGWSFWAPCRLLRFPLNCIYEPSYLEQSRTSRIIVNPFMWVLCHKCDFINARSLMLVNDSRLYWNESGNLYGIIVVISPLSSILEHFLALLSWWSVNVIVHVVLCSSLCVVCCTYSLQVWRSFDWSVSCDTS